ncbi:glycosyltransferase [Candidatus Uhrbacteria bacterium]|nr:glycosyltransferase [Candidatus Uhrbacteria bacterium]
MLTIVIPTKNEEAFLPKLLTSIRKQTFQPDKVIVSDAGSTDRTCEIARSYGAEVIEGGLPGAGRNRGAAQAQTDLILFLDADVELRDPEFLEKAVGEMLERKLDLATCDVFPLSDAVVDHFLHKAYNTYARAWGSLFPHAPGFCMFVRRDAHKKIGGFDESVLFCEDHDYAHRLKRVGEFGFLKATKIPVSIRRLDRDGRIQIAMKYLAAELHLALIGPIRHNKFNYTFGHIPFKKKKP